MKHAIFTATALIATSGMLHAANLNCNFTAECLETEACQETNYDVTVTDLTGTASFDSVTGSMTALVETTDANTTVSARDDSGMHLIVSTPDGSARYVNLMPDAPMVITYHGTCEMTDGN